MNGNKQKWKDYYSNEEQFFQYIKDNSESLRVDLEPEYIEKENYKIPVNYVRAIYRLREGTEEEFIQNLAKIKTLYNKAIGDLDNENFPSRFPIFYENVEQINITIHEAYSSINLKADTYFPILKISTESEMKLLDSMIKEFKKIGIKAKFEGVLSRFRLYINTDDLFNYAKTKNIQARRPSGRQYRALIRHNNESKGVRKSYGFIVLNSDSNASIYDAPPQASRPHKLDKTKEIIRFPDMPLELDYTFYKI